MDKNKKEKINIAIKCILTAIILIAIFVVVGIVNLMFIFKNPFKFAITVFIILSIIALIFIVIILIWIYQIYKNKKDDIYEKIFLD